ncbi:MAG: stalk domain-containing protein [Fimbriimonadaceae bacterium]
MRPIRASLTGIAIASLLTLVLADITVQYNGQSIAFPDAKPKMSDGRVLVPLRAVLDGMGIDVKFDPATNLITASKSETVVQLRLGEREGSVNGRPVYLDVPAQAVNGRTYVPLRFFGEAFGAEVKWRSFDETVLITKEVVFPPNTNNNTNPNPVAYSLSHNGTGWTLGGETLNFELKAAPGQIAKLYLQDGAIEIPFREVESGRYQANYIVPMQQVKAVSFQDLDAFAVIGTGASRIAIQTNQRVAVDNTRPDISSLEPKRLQKVVQRRPAITADLRDENGSGINQSTVKLWVDNKDVTSQAYVTERLIVLKPTQDLSIGKHDVKLTVTDNAGNNSTVETEFEIVAAVNLVQNFVLTPTSKLEPGDSVKINAMVGSDVKRVMVKLGNQDVLRQANLAADGKVSFAYTVAKGDSFDDSPITLLLEMSNGDKLEYVAESRLTMVGVVTPQPKLVSPEAGSNLGKSVVLTGTAEKAATVRIRVEYISSVFGLLQTQGLVKELEVEVNADGTFTTGSIALSGPLGSNPDSYKVTMIAISTKGRESDPVVANFKS